MMKTKMNLLETVKQTDELLEKLNKVKVSKKVLSKEIPEEIKQAIEQIVYIQSLESKLQKAKNTLKTYFKETMKKFNVNQIIVDTFKASFCEYSTTTFDMESFKKDYPKLYEKYLKTENVSRFSVNTNKNSKKG